MRAWSFTSLTLTALALVPGLVQASERNFSYTYESAVLAPGEKELELWTTYRRGRAQYYSQVENRLEVEFGVSDRLMMALYLNSSQTTSGTGTGTTTARVNGTSIEAKYKLADPVADPVGLALYGEVSLASHENEVEAKLIVDKRISRLLLAYNAVYEYEMHSPTRTTDPVQVIENDLGVTYFLQPRLSLGVEARTHQVLKEYTNTRGALFVGPVLGFKTESFWAVLTSQWQVASLGGETPGQDLEYNEHERVNVRLLVGTHF